MARIDGPFDHHPSTGAVIRSAGQSVTESHKPLVLVGEDLRSRTRAAAGHTENLPVTAASLRAIAASERLAAAAIVGGAVVQDFATAVTAYDHVVDTANQRWADAVTTGFGVPLADLPAGASPSELEDARDDHTREVAAARAELWQELAGLVRAAEDTLDARAGDAAGMLRDGPSEAEILRLFAAGMLPLSSPALFPIVDWSKADWAAAILAIMSPPAGPGGVPRGLTPEEILATYQVADDDVTTWPPWPLSIVEDPRTVTDAEASLLNGLGLLALRDFKDIADQAFAAADEQFLPEDRNDNHNDAFRHAYWNALLTKRFGEEWARNYTTAHEALPDNPAPREAMDLYNNEVGRQIAAANPDASEEELAGLVAQAVRDGDMVVVAPDGASLAYSNTIPEGGDTGDAEHAPPVPGADPDIDTSPDTDSHDDDEYGS